MVQDQQPTQPNTPTRPTPFLAQALNRYRQQRERVVLLEPITPRWLTTWMQASGWRPTVRPVPVRLQMTLTECGAACLAMILSYHGRQTSVAECRDSLGLGRDGMTALTLANAARAAGLRVRAFSTPPSALAQVPLPAIVHWNFNHFLVVEQWLPDVVVVVDPASGRQRMSHAEFEAGFTGVVLTFEPGVHFLPRATATTGFDWRRFGVTLVRQNRGLFGQILVASLVLQGFGLLGPLFTKVLVDTVLPAHLTSMMNILAVGVTVLALTHAATIYVRAVLLQQLQIRLDTSIMLGFFEHLLTLPYRFFEQRTSGDLLMRLSSNSVIRDTLTSQMLSLLLDTGLMLVYLGVLLVQNPLFGLGVLGVMGLQIALLAGSARRIQELNERNLAVQAESRSYIIDALNRMVMLKASGSEDRALEQWSNLFFKELNVSRQQAHLMAMMDTALMFIRTLAPMLLLWLSAQQVMAGTLSLGMMLALNALALSTLTPLASLITNGQRLQLVGAHLERLADIWEAPPEQARGQAQQPRLSGQITLEGVSFRYDPNAPAVLRNISVQIQPGQKVALVGRTGSGKSTLLKVLLGLYPTTEGTICFDGTPLSSLDYRALRSQCGVVLQEHHLFSGSLRENIGFNMGERDMESIVTAAHLAAIHDDIMGMAMQYETVLVEGGAGLSGGQCQRIALARALAPQPAILLLDEATSHLDTLTERVIEANLDQLACTRLVIAHRLSTIRNADLILVLDQGEIVERGTHAELMALGGTYATLVCTQQEPTAPAARAA